VYHINAVDTVTQWQVVGCVGQISEPHLRPVLEAILHQFPFQILGFHSDNGSEFVNYKVAKLLKGLLIEFTKSRANRTTDNALVEGKNGAVIRKHIGYGYIAAEHAEEVQKFYTAHLNPYLNFHRPCGFATVSLDARGKRKRKYKRDDYATPYEKWKSLPQAEKYLKPKMSFARLEEAALKMSDTECARRMSAAKGQLLRRCKTESPVAQKTAYAEKERAMEMTGPWKAWKSTSSFPPLSTAPWKSRQEREFPIFPQSGFAPDGKVENQKQVYHFPTRGSR
jgi:transposase InsO family protein